MNPDMEGHTHILTNRLKAHTYAYRTYSYKNTKWMRVHLVTVEKYNTWIWTFSSKTLFQNVLLLENKTSETTSVHVSMTLTVCEEITDEQTRQWSASVVTELHTNGFYPLNCLLCDTAELLQYHFVAGNEIISGPGLVTLLFVSSSCISLDTYRLVLTRASFKREL